MHLKYVREYRQERNLSIPYSESSITLIPKAEWLYQKRKVTKNLTYEYQCKNLKGNIKTEINRTF